MRQTNCTSAREEFCTACRLLQHPNTLTVNQLRNLSARADKYITDVFGDDLEAIRAAAYNGHYDATLAWWYIMGEQWNGSTSDYTEELPW